jgi:hypothetical protein
VRRTALLALLVVLLAAAAPAAAHASGSAPRTFERALPARMSAGAHWRTPPLRAGGRFELAGASWRGAAGTAELRAQLADGHWTRWSAVDAGDPVWSGAAQAVQLRGARPLHGLRVRFVSLGGAVAAGVPRATPATAGGRPPIVPRSAWDPQDTCHPRTPASYGRVDFAIVHHTESLSFYTPQQSAAMVLAICLFHRDGNRWNDIGYDLLVDRYGTIFEGRAGGLDQPVTGAQAGGWNAVSTGVALIGSYSAAPPPPPALRSLERVLAWKLSLAGLPATGSVVERSTGSDPVDNRWPRGALVRFQRISGHRDADLTDCPGNALYALLPQIRRAVAALLPPPRDQLTLAPVGALIDQGPFALTGRLSLESGRRPAGAAIAVQQQGSGGAWRTLAATRTGADGVWVATPGLLTSGPLRAVAPGAVQIASPAVTATVRAGVQLHVSATHLHAGGALRISGSTTPPKGRVLVLIARRGRTGGFGRPTAIAATTVAGRFALATPLPRRGLYRVVATTSADALNAAGSSPAVLVRVR